jgi:glutaredoxin
LRLRIYSKPDCHLCEEAKFVVDRIAKEFSVPVEVINIEQDRESYEKYRYDIPLIYLDDVKLFKHRVDEVKLRKVLNKVAQTSRLS